MDLEALAISPARITADDGIMANDSPRRMVEPGQDRLVRLLANLHAGNQFADFFHGNKPTINAQQSVCLSALAQSGRPPVGMSDGQVALLRKHDIVIQLQGQLFVELDALIVKCHPLRRAIIGANNGRMAPAGPAAQIPLIEDRDLADAVLAEVISDGQTMHPGADDDDVVGGLQIVAVPHALGGHNPSSYVYHAHFIVSHSQCFSERETINRLENHSIVKYRSTSQAVTWRC